MITRRALHIPELGAHGLDTPYFEIAGHRDSPQLTVLAGVHGTEYASIAVAPELVVCVDGLLLGLARD